MRFYLHGDVVPDTRVAATMPQVNELGQPLFEHRGIQPFHDFPEGPDWWDEEGYKAILAQLPKLRMNFFGLHAYPEGGVGPEPLVWIGMPDEIGEHGTVKASYPSRHFTTANPTGAWGYRGMRTGDYNFGAAGLFEADNFGPDYMAGTDPWTKLPPESSNALFGRMGRVLTGAFTFARQLGIKTCIGTETPLTIPTPVKERLKAAGKNPADPAVVQELYQGIFERIKQTHPLDYYWFWTPEGWTWAGTKQQDIDATLADFRAAMAAAKAVDAPFTLATCGWVLGPQQDRALFDNFLPKSFPMSCISRAVGHDPGGAGLCPSAGPPEVEYPVDGRRPGDDLAAVVGGPDAQGRRRFAGLRLHRSVRDPLADPDPGPERIGVGRRSLGSVAVEPRLDRPAAPRGKLPEGPDGGQQAHFPNNPIADTEDDPLYQDVRYDVDAYHLDVPNGKYTVTVKLCEPHYKEPNRRVFGIKVQGLFLVDQIDLFAKVGQNRAVDLTLKDVLVTEGRLVIDFVRIIELPSVAAIVVEGPVTRKINCGGPAWKDYRADWPPSQKSQRKRFLPVEDFYADWARAHFGPTAADRIAGIFTAIDGRLPRPSTWVNGPGGINPDGRPWDEVRKEYAFVDELAALRPGVQGAGNLERFDYWLDTFRYMRANARVNCTWHRCHEALKKVKAEKDAAAQKQLARERACRCTRNWSLRSQRYTSTC